LHFTEEKSIRINLNLRIEACSLIPSPSLR
jgi:hypothetical protein